MTASTWYNADRVRQPGSVVLRNWLATRGGAEARAGVGPVRNVSSSDRDSMLELFGVNPGASGMAVTAESAMRVSAVGACVARITGGVSTLPLHVYERRWDETSRRYQRSRVDNADLWWLLNEQPTAGFTAVSHWERCLEAKLLRGDGFTWIRRKPSGAIAELVPLAWSAVTPKLQPSGRLVYAVQDDGRTFGVDQDDMLHWAGWGFDGERGESVIRRVAKQAVGNALAMDEYSGAFFGNGAHPSIVLEAEGKMNGTQVEALQTAFVNKHSGVQNAHRLPLVLTEGIKAREISISAADAQLLEARKFQVIDIARAFGVPPHMIGETSASTSWGSGIEAMSRAFVQFTLQPHLVQIEQELNRKLFRTSRYFVEFDRSALLQGDSQAQANYFKAALGGPGSGPAWMSVDEVRNANNLPPMGGKSAVPYHPGDEQQAAQPADGGAA